ncbi:TPA: hypothetical protein PXD63_004264 [Pseudomonas aeruginosa]|nr:hypothetical protein [Pseudomonas aeruginosa]
MNKANECSCPSGDGSLVHPCPAHPAVEQACWDERDFQAKGAQEVPSPVSKEYDRHLIGLLRKGEALPGHQEEAADEIERLRDWNDHLNNTVLPNILNPNFLMLMKGGERLLDLCTKDGEFIGVSLNDMKDVFDWMVTHARIAPDQAALAQPSPTLPPFAEKVLAKLRRFNECAEDSDSGGVDIGRHWLDLLTQLGLLNRVQRSPALWEISQQGEDLLGLDVPEIEVPDSMIEKAWQRFERTLQQLETPGQAEQAEQAEAERPEVVGSLYLGGWADQEELEDNDVELDMKVVERLQVDLASKGDGVHMPLMTVAQHERITAQLHDALDESDGDRWKLRSERDAAQARVAGLEAELETERMRLAACGTAALGYFDGCADAYKSASLSDVLRLRGDCDAALARVAELERQEPVALANRGLHAFWVKWTEAAAGLYGPGIKLYAAPVALAQHSVPGDIMRDAQRYRWLRDQQFYFSFSTENSDAGISSCTAGMSSRFKNLSWVDAAIDSAIAAAPGKEVGHE